VTHRVFYLPFKLTCADTLPCLVLYYMMLPAFSFAQMRMRCRQPVLIQGDTGVGKTALLRNLCKIVQWELHVLDVHGGLTVSNRQSNGCNALMSDNFNELHRLYENIVPVNSSTAHRRCVVRNVLGQICDHVCHHTVHAGHYFVISCAFASIHAAVIHEQDSDITEWMQQHIALCARHTPVSKLVLMLDEINTCNSLGLFKEILCDRYALHLLTSSDHVSLLAATDTSTF
jgi:Cdc6-like AAA superfamily ATPase